MEQTGDSIYISGVRTGVKRTGLLSSNHEFECTDDGVYFLAYASVAYELEGRPVSGNAKYIFFSPHDSNQVIKLCGRPDCTHSTIECNACFLEAISGICYYNDHLYVATLKFDGKEMFDLYRVDLDGSNRIKVGSFGDKSQYSGGSYTEIVDGMFTYTVDKVDNKTGERITDRYYYALDGSMKEPVLAENQYDHINQEYMDVRVVSNGDDWGYSIYSADFRNDEWTFAFDASKYQNGYWGKEAGYVLLGDAITKVHYSDGHEEVLFRTGLEGTYHPRFFPDCIVLTQIADVSGNVPEVPVVYFYSWEGELLGELPVAFPYQMASVIAVMGGGESKDRIYVLTHNSAGYLPQYYIDKSEFGTGQLQLHKLEYPDLTEEEYQFMFTPL